MGSGRLWCVRRRVLICRPLPSTTAPNASGVGCLGPAVREGRQHDDQVYATSAPNEDHVGHVKARTEVEGRVRIAVPRVIVKTVAAAAQQTAVRPLALGWKSETVDSRQRPADSKSRQYSRNRDGFHTQRDTREWYRS